MKAFIAIQVNKKRVIGGREITVDVYRVKYNVPQFIGTIKYNTDATKGEKSVVVEYLVEKGYLPKSSLKGGYMDMKKWNKKYKLAFIESLIPMK